MRVHTCIPSGARELLLVLIGDMLSGFGVPIALAETKVYRVDDVLGSLGRETYQEVVRFDISVNEMVVVKELDAL